jgi:hypothetical protein
MDGKHRSVWYSANAKFCILIDKKVAGGYGMPDAT